jgi:AcrR family transcriptional regulator
LISVNYIKSQKTLIMSPRTKKQFEEIREERRTQIMVVALELFAQHGFSNVTIARIAQKAGISKGLLYNYFDSKEQLVFEIMMMGFNAFIEVFDPNKDGVLTYEELHFFIDETFRIIQFKQKFWKLYFSILFQPEVLKLIKPKMNEILGPYLHTLSEYFVQNGSQDINMDMRFFGSIMDGICLNFVLDPQNFPIEAMKNRIHDIYR